MDFQTKKTILAVALGLFTTLGTVGWWIYSGQITCQIVSELPHPQLSAF